MTDDKDVRFQDENMSDIVDIEDNEITLKNIIYIAKNERTRKQYEKEFKKNLYSNILLSLTHEFFSEEKSKELWGKILCHMNDLNETLGRDAGITVAALDYLSNIEKILHDPKIIEEGKSGYIVSTTLIDNLTNLFIRNVFDVVLEKEFNMSKRDKFPLSLLMIDIDDFKAINDTYGHSKGDEVLKGIGQIINNSVRSMDFAARYGGEELSVIMPYTDSIRAYRIGNRIRKRVANHHFDEFKVTVSIGVSTISEDINTTKLLIKSADGALYQAKEHGKNLIRIHTSIDG